MLLTIFSNNSLCLKFAFFAQNMFFLVQCWKQLLYCLSSFVSSTSSSSFSTLSCVLEDHINHYYMIKAPSSKGFMFLPSLFLPCRWALLTGQHQKGERADRVGGVDSPGSLSHSQRATERRPGYRIALSRFYLSLSLSPSWFYDSRNFSFPSSLAA